MIGNKYGKVIIIALINIIAVCFVYNNVATDDNNVVHAHLEDGRQDKETKDTLKHVGKTSMNVNHGQINQLDKISDTDNSNVQTNDKSIIENSQDISKHDAVMAMKNLLSIQIKAVRVNKTTPVPALPVQDEELYGRLLDSSEIDLSPPNPIIKSTSDAITDQVKINKPSSVARVKLYISRTVSTS